MKKIFYMGVILSIFMLAVPLISIGMKVEGEKVAKNDDTINSEKLSETENNKEQSDVPIINLNSSNTFKILDTSTQNIVEVSDRDFIYGAVCAEIPYTFNAEMLKAQAVASYTYYSRLREQEKQNPTESLKGADFSCDLSVGESYATESFLKERWGDNYDNNFSIVKNAVDKVIGEVLVYDNDLALTCYHAISYGVTESSENVFSQSLPYLQSVASSGDVFTDGYCTSVSLSADELKKLFNNNYTVNFGTNMNDWIKISSRSNAGTVLKATVGDKTFTGLEIRNILSLRSANFTVVYSQEKFVFTVYGYGHSVGMSQWGGEYMAQQGADYKEILSTYYKGTVISKVDI